MRPPAWAPVLRAALLVALAEGSLNVQPAMRGDVVVERAFVRPPRAAGCSSTDGPLCAPLAAIAHGRGGGEEVTVEETGGGVAASDDALWQLLGEGVDSGIFDDDPVLEGAERPDELRAAWREVGCGFRVSAALDLAALPPWLQRAPLDFAAGLPTGVALAWAGDWQITAAPRRRARTRAALRLTGIGSVRFSQPVLVSELPLQSEGGAVLIVGYLGGQAIWRVKIGESWQNGARGLWAVDELSFVPVGSALLGGMTIAKGQGDCVNYMPVNTVVVDSTGGMRLMRTTISPLAPVMVLQDVFHEGLVIARPRFSDLPRAWDQLPSLDEIKQVFEALENGMRLPAGVTWPQIEAEAERFHGALSTAAGAERSDQSHWWHHFWSSHRFDVLEACFLTWLHAPPRPAQTPGSAVAAAAMAGTGSPAQDVAPKSKAEMFLEQLVGGAASKALVDVMGRMSPEEGDASFAESFEQAIEALMEAATSDGDEPQQEVGEADVAAAAVAAAGPAAGGEAETHVTAASIAAQGAAARGEAEAGAADAEPPAKQEPEGDDTLRDLLGDLRAKKAELEGILEAISGSTREPSDRPSSGELPWRLEGSSGDREAAAAAAGAEAAVGPLGSAGPGGARPGALAAAADPVAPRSSSEGAWQWPAVVAGGAAEAALWWRLSGLVGAVLLLALLALPGRPDRPAVLQAQAVWV